MRISDVQQLRLPFSIFVAALLATCGAVPDARPISLDSPDAQRVREALARWPHPAADAPLRRAFSAVMRFGNVRTTATGTLEYYAPRDFRVMAATADGAILFDGRFNWGGAMILRERPGVDSDAIEMLLADMVRAFELPARLEGLEAGAKQMVLTRTRGDAHECTWIFDRADGRLVQTQVDMGLLDMLRIYYGGYSLQGWPGQLRLVRFARQYEVSFSFADERLSEARP
jgi:hypothetical protein